MAEFLLPEWSTYIHQPPAEALAALIDGARILITVHQDGTISIAYAMPATEETDSGGLPN